MRRLLDENLSKRAVPLLADAFPGTAHVDLLGLHGADDALIWTFAGSEGYVVVSKDADFYQRSVAFGPPPKVVWLRIGNGPVAAVVRLLNESRTLIEQFGADSDAGFLVLPLAATS